MFPDFGLCQKNGKRMADPLDGYASSRESAIPSAFCIALLS